jgi:hypothetical protein
MCCGRSGQRGSIQVIHRQHDLNTAPGRADPMLDSLMTAGASLSSIGCQTSGAAPSRAARGAAGNPQHDPANDLTPFQSRMRAGRLG